MCGSGQKRGVFTAAHTYTEHICEYPPPPPGDISKPHTFKWGTLADDVFPSANFTLPPKPRPPTPVSILVNKSIHSGTLPDTLKLATAIPIYKAKAKDNMSNYMCLPISLLPALSKIPEKAEVHR